MFVIIYVFLLFMIYFCKELSLQFRFMINKEREGRKAKEKRKKSS